jgi:DNA polymerase III delta prime subunit
MDIKSDSSIWEHKYKPCSVKDLILPKNITSLFDKYVKDGDIPQLLFASTAGRGKTSSAFALCNDLGADKMYINGSIDTSVDTLRYQVTQFASTSSFSDGKKICIIDECERLSPNAQDGLKGIMDMTESNCRFILTTNNLSKIIPPIQSRGTLINFNFSKEDMKSLIIAYFKRMCFVLDNEKIPYDKKILAEFTQQKYPDFRSTILGLQKAAHMYGQIDENIFKSIDGSQFTSLVSEMKEKKYNNVRKIIAETDPDTFYQTFYNDIENLVEPNCIPNIVMILGRFTYESALSISKEITLAACVTEIMREAKWK